MDGAGVDLLALIQLGEQAPLFQDFCADGGDVHEGLRTGCRLLLAVDLYPGGQIPLVGGLHVGVVDLNFVQVGGESGVAAVVGPVGVHHPDLSDGGVPLFLVPEVGLQEFQIVDVHCQPQLVQQGGQGRFVHGGEAGHRIHMVGDGVLPRKGFRLVHGGLPALHRVDEVLFDLLPVLLGQGTLNGIEKVDRGAGYQGPVHPGHELDALGRRVRPLVELPRQGLHRQGVFRGSDRGIILVIDVVHLGLGENNALGPLKDLLGDILHIVAVEDGQVLQILDAQLPPKLVQQGGAFDIILGLFRGIAAVNTHGLLSSVLMLCIVVLGRDAS